MKKAVEADQTKETGYKKPVKLFNVPRTTLKDCVKKTDESVEDIVSKSMERRPVLPVELEKELVNYCLQMEKNYYGVTASDLKRIDVQLTIRNNIPHPFSQTKKKAGNKLKLFMARHPDLSFSQPESLSRARVQGFTSENIKTFFDTLKPELKADEEDSDNDDVESLVSHKSFSQGKRVEKCFQWMPEDCVENPGANIICATCLEN